MNPSMKTADKAVLYATCSQSVSQLVIHSFIIRLFTGLQQQTADEKAAMLVYDL